MSHELVEETLEERQKAVRTIVEKMLKNLSPSAKQEMEDMFIYGSAMKPVLGNPMRVLGGSSPHTHLIQHHHRPELKIYDDPEETEPTSPDWELDHAMDDHPAQNTLLCTTSQNLSVDQFRVALYHQELKDTFYATPPKERIQKDLNMTAEQYKEAVLGLMLLNISIEENIDE